MLLATALVIHAAAVSASEMYDTYENTFTYAESSEEFDFQFLEGGMERGAIAPLSLNATTSRGRGVSMLVMGQENALVHNGNLPAFRFPDVPMQDWFFPLTTWAGHRGWVAGDGSGNFRPHADFCRESFIVMLVRAVNPQPVRHANLSFADTHQISAWARPYVERAVYRGWVFGFAADNTFRPQSLLSRGDAITFIGRATGRAIADPVFHTITWNANSGTTVPQWRRIQWHALGPLPATSRSGFTFASWARDGGQINQNTSMLGQDITHAARWNVNITWNANGGSGGTTWTRPSNTQLGSLPANPSRTDHTFQGWFTTQSGGTQVTAETWVLNANPTVTYWARWRPNFVTVTWNANGGNVNPSNWPRHPNGERLGTLPTPTRANHTFQGWYTTQTGGSRITADTRPTGNVTYWARWRSNNVSVTVPLIPQIRFNWCWAASSTMVLRNRGNTAVSQSAIVWALRGNYDDRGASRAETVAALRMWSGGESARGDGAITVSSVRTELYSGRPLIMGVYGSHMMVIYGHNFVTEEFLIRDPWPVNMGARYTLPVSYAQTPGVWSSTIRA